MADKTIGDLNNAPGTVDDSNTLFVVQQAGTAYKLDGHAFILALTSILDGHGGINSIVYTAPVAPSLDGTLTITLADTTQTSLTIKNGKGIVSIAKTGTAGLVDTYTITYNDGTTGTFTVTNGAKGDTGDAWYVWIRYAGQQPTQDSDIGTTPDNWMGVYSGTSSTAPTHYTDYQWFQIKGAKGDTGNPATIQSTAIEYQASSSGTTVPSGTWSTTIPSVTQGQYLWTRTTVTFNSGSPVVWYSVSYIAVDGSGSPGTATPLVDSGSGVVGVAMSYSRQDHQHPLNVATTGTPQMDGTASRGSEPTYARSDHIHPHDTSKADTGLGITGASVGDMVRISAVDANNKPTAFTKVPINEIKCGDNMLDNWYFLNPVNQRGQSSYSNANAYTIDRWKLTSGSLTVASGGITLNGTIVQILPASIGLPVVASALLSDRTMITPSYDDSTKTFTLTATGQTIAAVKLEIGSVQTLAHQENGAWVLNEIPDYGDELAKCQRYYVKYYSADIRIIGGVQIGGNIQRCLVVLPVQMVNTPLSIALNGQMQFVGNPTITVTTSPVSWTLENTNLYMYYTQSSSAQTGLFPIRLNGSKLEISCEP